MTSETVMVNVIVTPPLVISMVLEGETLISDKVGASKSCPYTLKFKTLIALKKTNTIRIIKSFLFIVFL